MRSILVIVAVALVALIGGIAVTGLPDSVPQDVVSGDIRATAPALPTSSCRGGPGEHVHRVVGESALTVVVADATNAPGLAASVAQQLSKLGYAADVVATDATAPRRETVVVYAAGREGEARRLAEQLGLASTQVEPLADEPRHDWRCNGRSVGTSGC